MPRHMCPKECCAKLQFVGRMFLVGAGDFSPPQTVIFSGLKSRAPKDLSPRQIAIFSA